jgi:hypothetical protein
VATGVAAVAANRARDPSFVPAELVATKAK